MLAYKKNYWLLWSIVFSIFSFVFISYRTWKINTAPSSFTEVEWELIQGMAQRSELPTDKSNKYSQKSKAKAFGKRLFFEKKLSKNGKIACASCHQKAKNWTDGRTVAQGLKQGTKNTPSLWNISFNRWFFWDGRADSPWAQALQPMENPAEMGSSRLAILHTIRQDETLHQLYQTTFDSNLDELKDTVRFPSFGSPAIADTLSNPWLGMIKEDQQLINQHFVNIGKAIAAFEETILSSATTFDEFVYPPSWMTHEERETYPEEAIAGLKLFIGKAGCVNCHSGALFTNFEFHNIRLDHLDGGRYDGIRKLVSSEFNKNGDHSDDSSESRIEYLKLVKRNWGEFKVPSLRKVSLTAPYMHDGRFPSLEAVINYYSELQGAIPDKHVNETLIRPLNLAEEEKKALVAFLKTL